MRIPDVRQVDVQSKLTPYTGITSEGLNPHGPLLNYPSCVRFDPVSEAKTHPVEEKQQQGRAHIAEHVQDTVILPLIGGLTSFIQEVDLMP